ncbi:DUF4440 domain-containing protein [Teredinibacter turnerae]|uniref:nuclear transport factor 2 family protein n=1 Tax=Teredinibacter turnerae TaxID=2426 RepID=UPI00036FA07B|nr:nuclear transport factor 2 family protein [Teredinibacter turnerae]
MHEVIELEKRLHELSIRSSRPTLESVLHPEFVEIGYSGTEYVRQEVLVGLVSRSEMEQKIFARDFCLAHLTESLCLITYKSASVQEDGELHRFAIRSSIWKFDGRRWQLRFHQATPTEGFSTID